MEIWYGKGRKHCGKRRKCWLPSFSPFTTMFSKGFFLKVIKSQDCVVKSETLYNISGLHAFRLVKCIQCTVVKVHINKPYT